MNQDLQPKPEPIDAAVAKSAPRAAMVRANPAQVKILNAAFEKSEATSQAILQDLEKETGLSQKWISSWFVRQRTKKRRATEGRAPPNDNGLAVKKEACEEAMNLSATSHTTAKRKSQSNTADGNPGPSKKAKRRKVNVVVDPKPPPPAASLGGRSTSLRDRISVKVERYTPIPDWEQAASIKTPNLAEPSTAEASKRFGPATEALQTARDGTRSFTSAAPAQTYRQIPAGTAPSYSSMNWSAVTESTFSRLPVATLAHHPSPSVPVAPSPSLVAMKSRQQRMETKHYVSPTLEAPRTHFRYDMAQNARAPHQASSLSLAPELVPAPAASSVATTVSNRSIYRPPQVDLYHAQLSGQQYSRLDRPTPLLVSASAPATPKMYPPPAFDRHTEHPKSSTELNSRLAYPSDFPGSYREASSPWTGSNMSAVSNAGTPYYHPQRGIMEHSQFRAYEPVTKKFTVSAHVDENLSPYDPMHAPMKHLRDILSPIRSNSGYISAFEHLDNLQRQTLMDKLLDEDLAKTHPFKATMGLVMASNLGLRWA